ncbi:O-antigen ligase [Pseudoalteromonas sp. SG45-1]|uniref:O-antigen ligase family protein n=1 Tax=Pseudoalteromonas sp. SG45-1 TaxID=2760957 RepID=UPI001602B511|nr:O-antigen ligase family protein [Pseudoalteromonas sp. SG45-1]MBB1400965.1 O-antigen ligase family protein [Pseudoalteromonas sp. SG45-1]
MRFEKGDNLKNRVYCFVIFASIFASRLNFDIGISIQLFHIIFIFLLASALYVVPKKLLVDEFLLLIFYILFSFTGINAIEPSQTLIMILGLGVVINYSLISRCFFTRLSLANLLNVFSKVGKLIFWLSISLYLLGFCFFFLFGLNEGEKFLGVMIEKGIVRAIGISTDPNFLSLISLVFVFYFLDSKDKRLYAYGFIILILLSLSRGGMASLLIGGVVYILRSDYKKIIYLALIVSIFFIISKWILDFDIINVVLEKRISGLENGGGRFDIWSQGLHIFKGNEIFGIGIFQFKTYNILYFSDIHYLHNTYFEVLIEGGIIVFSIFILSIACFSKKFLFLYCYDKKSLWIFPTIISFFVCIFGLSAYSSPILYTFIAFMNSVYLLNTPASR